MKFIGYIILVYLPLSWADITAVQESHGLPGSSFSSFTGEAGLRSFFSQVVGVLQDVTAVAGVVGVCIVGIMYIMSRGEEEKTSNAKKYMIAIIIGTLLAFSAWGIISLINLIPGSLRF